MIAGLRETVSSLHRVVQPLRTHHVDVPLHSKHKLLTCTAHVLSADNFKQSDDTISSSETEKRRTRTKTTTNTRKEKIPV